MRLRYIPLCLLLALSSASAAPTNELPKFDEVYQLLRANLAGASASDLDQAAVRGLLAQLQPQVILGDSSSESSTNTPSLSKTEIYEDRYEYFRFNRVDGDLVEKLDAAHKRNIATNKIRGVVLDLRFANGMDYAAAGALANLFVKTEQPLLDWGTGTARSTAKTNAISLPVAVLVNSKTSGAAEALAAVLRETRVGLLVGSTTAGQASIFKDFPVSNGQNLRVATAQVKVGDNKVLSKGLVPDIVTRASLEDEKVYLENPYKVLNPPPGDTNLVDAGLTNRPFRRLNEAELVRQQREGADLDGETPSRRASARSVEEPARPLLTDPALVRAIDLLKALAVVRQGRSN